MTRRIKRTATVTVASVIALALWLLWVSWRRDANLLGCIDGNGCQGIHVMAGSTAVEPAKLDQLMKSSVLKSAASCIKRCYLNRMEDQNVYVLVVGTQIGDEAVLLSVLHSESGDVFSLGNVINAIFKAKILSTFQGPRTLGNLNSRLADMYKPLASILTGVGISSIVVGNTSVPVEDLSSVYTRIAKDNFSRPFAVLRP